ncbi:hypothetical protein I547_5534 [Mycobacterium kansasii 824]|nr:hypothetical protein I547_5534 [Mycobacterium kansasii 824]
MSTPSVSVGSRRSAGAIQRPGANNRRAPCSSTGSPIE